MPTTMKIKEEEEVEKEKESKINLRSCKVVEYLEPIMSKELLYKFPDKSAFDFNYAQSSLWSPLVPRIHSPMDLDMVTPRKLNFGFGLELLGSHNRNRSGSSQKLTPKFKKKIKTSIENGLKMKLDVNVLKMMQHNKKNKVKAYEFSPTPVMAACAPFTTKGWNKVLKAASKHFKKKKRKDPPSHVKLSNYLREW